MLPALLLHLFPLVELIRAQHALQLRFGPGGDVQDHRAVDLAIGFDRIGHVQGAGRDVLGRREFSIPADEFSSVRLRMGREAFRDIKKKGPREAKVLVITRGDDGELRREEADRKIKRKKKS